MEHQCRFQVTNKGRYKLDCIGLETNCLFDTFQKFITSGVAGPGAVAGLGAGATVFSGFADALRLLPSFSALLQPTSWR